MRIENGAIATQASGRQQEGFGAFSVSQSQVPKLILYIQNQELHHKKRSFQSEYLDFLKAYEIDFKPEYLFEPIT
jgi:hypothetical protein